MTAKSPRSGHCELCPRVVPKPELDLTEMRKPGVAQSLSICNDPACWKASADLGYRLQGEDVHESDATA